MSKLPIHVTHFHRRPHETYFSIERVFGAVREYLPAHIRCHIAVSKYESRGIFRRLYNMVEAVFRQNTINHVTGDVHFLCYLIRKRRTVLTVHDLNLLERSDGIMKQIYLFFWYIIPISRCEYVTVISEKVRQELLSRMKCDSSRVCVIYNPVPIGFQASLKKFNVQTPVILQIGTGKNKNILRIADALNGVPCFLRIIGKLSLKQNASLERNGIEYCGVLRLSDEQIVAEYMRCDLLVFVSTYEGFGMPIIEANAVGRPVVTSNFPPMSEVAEGAVCLVNPFDVNSIRQGILKIIEDKCYREELVVQGLQNAKKYHPRIIAAKYSELYEKIYESRL